MKITISRLENEVYGIYTDGKLLRKFSLGDNLHCTIYNLCQHMGCGFKITDLPTIDSEPSDQI